MKRVMFIIIATAALGCNSDQRSSEAKEQNIEQQQRVAPSGSDTSSIHTDTTTSGGMNRQNQYDTLK